MCNLIEALHQMKQGNFDKVRLGEGAVHKVVQVRKHWERRQVEQDNMGDICAWVLKWKYRCNFSGDNFSVFSPEMGLSEGHRIFIGDGLGNANLENGIPTTHSNGRRTDKYMAVNDLSSC